MGGIHARFLDQKIHTQAEYAGRNMLKSHTLLYTKFKQPVRFTLSKLISVCVPLLNTENVYLTVLGHMYLLFPTKSFASMFIT